MEWMPELDDFGNGHLHRAEAQHTMDVAGDE